MAEHIVAWTAATFGVVAVALALAGLTGAACVCAVVAVGAVAGVVALTREPTLRVRRRGYGISRDANDFRSGERGARP